MEGDKIVCRTDVAMVTGSVLEKMLLQGDLIVVQKRELGDKIVLLNPAWNLTELFLLRASVSLADTPLPHVCAQAMC